MVVADGSGDYKTVAAPQKRVRQDPYAKTAKRVAVLAEEQRKTAKKEKLDNKRQHTQDVAGPSLYSSQPRSKRSNNRKRSVDTSSSHKPGWAKDATLLWGNIKLVGEAFCKLRYKNGKEHGGKVGWFCPRCAKDEAYLFLFSSSFLSEHNLDLWTSSKTKEFVRNKRPKSGMNVKTLMLKEWGVAVTLYLEAASAWPHSGNPQNQGYTPQCAALEWVYQKLSPWTNQENNNAGFIRRGGGKATQKTVDGPSMKDWRVVVVGLHKTSSLPPLVLPRLRRCTTITKKESRALSANKKSRFNQRKLVFKIDDLLGRNKPDLLKEDIISKTTEHSDFKSTCPLMARAMKTQLASHHKTRQYRLHKHYLRYLTKEEVTTHPPNDVKVAEWVLQCYRISTTNKQNRACNEVPPTVGTKSVARRIHMKRKRGKEVTAIEGYKIAHYSKKKKAMINDKANEIWEDYDSEDYDEAQDDGM
ncbi:Myb domain protein 62 [Tanacetum coccineum]